MPTDHKKSTILTKSSVLLDRTNSVFPTFRATYFIQAIIVLIYINTGNESFSSVHLNSILLGGSLSVGGFIRFITIICFVWGLQDIRFRWNPENGMSDVRIYHRNGVESYESIELANEQEKVLISRANIQGSGLITFN